MEIWPENETAVELFHRVQTQWREGMGGPTGLDYAAAESVIRLMDPDAPLETLDQLQVMELEALDVFREQRERD